MKKYLRKAINWLLIVMTVLYLATGFALVHKYGFDLIFTHEAAIWLHKNLAVPFIITILAHVFTYSKFKFNFGE